MLLNTKHFGEIEIDESKIITFNHGIPGFADNKKYAIITDETPGSLYCWLQSIDDGDIAFVLIDSFTAMPNYNPLVSQDEVEELGEVDLADLIMFNIAVISKNINESTINLKAPVIINEKTLLGKQIIVNNDEYNIRHNLAECLQNGGAL